jgi:hypothetical protein
MVKITPTIRRLLWDEDYRDAMAALAEGQEKVRYAKARLREIARNRRDNTAWIESNVRERGYSPRHLND